MGTVGDENQNVKRMHAVRHPATAQRALLRERETEEAVAVLAV